MTHTQNTTIAQIALDAYRACGPDKDWTCAVDSALQAAGVETLGSLGVGYDLEQETDALAAVLVDGRVYVIVHDEQADRASCELRATDAQIRQLRSEAGAAGDSAQVELCDAALGGDGDARAECARVIADAAAQDDDA